MSVTDKYFALTVHTTVDFVFNGKKSYSPKYVNNITLNGLKNEISQNSLPQTHHPY